VPSFWDCADWLPLESKCRTTAGERSREEFLWVIRMLDCIELLLEARCSINAMLVRWISNRHTSHTLVGIETGKTRSLVRLSITKEKKENSNSRLYLGWVGLGVSRLPWVGGRKKRCSGGLCSCRSSIRRADRCTVLSSNASTSPAVNKDKYFTYCFDLLSFLFPSSFLLVPLLLIF
jgi:hypothetical protein